MKLLLICLLMACGSPQLSTSRQSVDLATEWVWHPLIPYSAAHAGPDGHDFLYDLSGKPAEELIPFEQGNRIAKINLTTLAVTDFPMSQSGPEDTHYCDLDKDGIPDMVVAGSGNSRVWVVFGGTTTIVTITASQNHGRYLKVTCGDFDGDGNVDIAAGSYAGTAVVPAVIDILYGSGSRLGTSFTYQLVTLAGRAMTVDAVDLDGDGDLDLLVTDRLSYKTPDNVVHYDLEGVRMERNDGGKVWTNVPILSAPYAGEQFFAVTYDWNHDGHPDIIAVRSHAGVPNYTDIFLGPAFTSHTLITDSHSEGAAQGVAAGDLDGDGCDDLVYTSDKADTCCDQTRSGVWQLHNNCDGTFTWGEISGHDGTKFDGISLIDMDGDGDPDVPVEEQVGVTTTTNQLGVGYYENRIYTIPMPDGTPDAAVAPPDAAPDAYCHMVCE